MQTAAVIPTRNRKTMITRAIDSVLSQTEPVDEIIVVDDGSTDGTGSKEIPALVRRVQLYAASHCPDDRELAAFLTTHLHIVSKEHHTWNTVQDWFTSLQKHALL